MHYVIAALVVLLFALFFFIGGFLLKDSRKSERAAVAKVVELKKELEICRKSNP
ncbi:hypothetical protein UFOVP33_56 [uncultured Caudovirales phage]|uniref:Uncharacterized protein n=1 Tax=uncultured Caudovirales phage TaxID=2100421 RepID=A0A6J5KN71_9CAUD|nr:hypothetical protein UFOVP33_56 [uncultured Caudovirales phage]